MKRDVVHITHRNLPDKQRQVVSIITGYAGNPLTAKSTILFQKKAGEISAMKTQRMININYHCIQ